MNKVLLLISLGLLSFLVFLLGRNESIKKDLSLLNYSNQSFEKSIDSFNREILNQNTLIAKDKGELKFLLDSIERINHKIKNPVVFKKSSSVIGIKDTLLLYDTISYVNNLTDTVYLRCVSLKDAWATLDICDQDSALKINEISFRDTSIFIIEKSGIFKSKYSTTVINSNPYKETNELKSIIVEDKKSRRIKNSLKAIGVVGIIVLAIL